MMQGTFFLPDYQSIRRISLTEEGRLHAVAVSILSSPGTNRVWSMMTSHSPVEIYRSACARSVPSVQSYLTGTYPGEPLGAAAVIIRNAEAKKIRICTFWDEDYPALLREIQCPPPVLYIKGTLPEGPAVAMVGTRKSDPRSSAIARRLSRELSARGFAIVSGMAVGVDREAHLGALDGGGATVGVLANGIDIMYPRPNRDLYRIIEGSAGSALISEYPPGIFAGRWTFVRRNRIISGLCAGTVVIKAGERSGALITARHAVEQNREVFVCAGNSFDEDYAGCHRLIRSGAVLVSCTDDIIGELGRFPSLNGFAAAAKRGPDAAGNPREGNIPDPDSLEGRILAFLTAQGCDIDAMARQMAVSAGKINEAVIALELEGRITRNGTMVYRL